MSVRVLVAALVVQLVLGAALVLVAVNGFPTFGTASPAGSFDGARALADTRAIVGFGPRPTGSPAARRLAGWLRARLPHGRTERVEGGLRNVVGSLPGRRPAILLAAHYDTKDLPGFVGANDGAAGSAVVLGVARELAHEARPPSARELRFVLFDGEESPRGTPDTPRAFARRGLRGSRAYALRHGDELGSAIVVDFVGQPGARWRREAGSDPALWRRLRAAADRARVGDRVPGGTAPAVVDDHTPFRTRGIPAVDLIDFRYPCFHRRCDTLARIDQTSLDSVGEALVELLR